MRPPHRTLARLACCLPLAIVLAWPLHGRAENDPRYPPVWVDGHWVYGEAARDITARQDAIRRHEAEQTLIRERQAAEAAWNAGRPPVPPPTVYTPAPSLGPPSITRYRGPDGLIHNHMGYGCDPYCRPGVRPTPYVSHTMLPTRPRVSTPAASVARPSVSSPIVPRRPIPSGTSSNSPSTITGRTPSTMVRGPTPVAGSAR